MIDIIVRLVDGYGYLPIIVKNGKEVYRGEYHYSAQHAFDRAMERMPYLELIDVS